MDFNTTDAIKILKNSMYMAFDCKDLNEIKMLSQCVSKFEDSELIVDLLIYILECYSDIDTFECFINEIDINKGHAWINVICTRVVKPRKIPQVLAYVKNVNQSDTDGETVLMLLIDDVLRDERAFINDTEYSEQFINKIKILLEHGADPHKTNRANKSAIDVALRLENPMEILLLLLDSASKKIKIMTLIIALSYTKHKYRYDVIELLLRYIDDINEPLYGSRSILQYAITKHVDMDIIELLKMNGAKTF